MLFVVAVTVVVVIAVGIVVVNTVVVVVYIVKTVVAVVVKTMVEVVVKTVVAVVVKTGYGGSNSKDCGCGGSNSKDCGCGGGSACPTIQWAEENSGKASRFPKGLVYFWQTRTVNKYISEKYIDKTKFATRNYFPSIVLFLL